ncbi:bifunctional diaminohydroxyphosphoribosylaminopyrimidine deaminase/5-amino-6-(5-phosphoribosylamino)uracil reductase RibD [Dehalobacter sp. DCM]|uniref:bifunctional diaminohydroxyphosphoribosylaminopyrimidine deaminase/5-amino-6-(5-phosphoribosylamino)uracil reductase RibD n=1 Tax=Dehalobacter sp. DCM TaxID=2907827 RepID=UPI0030819717|nr:bifunctional diaminohydroxyphosphoribosylaminopyrimidine deaminase/5-amino-6-(5-phosphoribosylamino)uracil reductase RibD [Dehalobacter sp. DCM]
MNNCFTSEDREYMERALNLSLLAAGRTSPNPLVGCVIVRDGQIVGEGYHQKAGTPHAEVHALNAAGIKAKDADVYVTLEPCSHFGRTPPCADALIANEVRRVVIAMSDPNPLVSGQGIKKLQAAGIIVESGLLSDQARRINEAFSKAITEKMPFVLYKAATTLDGKTAVSTGDSKWITSPEARHYVHELRNIYDVIMVGSPTVLQDDPQLTCRDIPESRDPVRLVVDGTLSLPIAAKVLNSTSASPCIIATTLAAADAKIQQLKETYPGDRLEIWQYPTARHVPLSDLMRDIAARGLNSILLESGGILAGKMLELKLIDKVEFIIAPLLAGSGPSPLSGLHLSKMTDAIRINPIEFNEIGGNYRFTGYINKG